MEWFDILHHGAVNGVTGSCHELRLAQSDGVLIDCGLFQGAEISGNGAGSNALGIDFSVDHIQALIVTHVHIDHVGRIPHLIAAGFRGPIYCSVPSAKLLPLVLEDALKIGVTRDKALIDQFLAVIKRRLRPLPYHQWQSVFTSTAGSLDIRLQPAGHILGSAYVECELNSSPSGEKHRVVFSGDLGAPHTPLLKDPHPPEKANTLVIESTYGDNLHPDRTGRQEQLRRVIERSLRDGGAVLIPAFSIGRTQELIYELEGLIHSIGQKRLADRRQSDHNTPLKWQDIQILIDSPLASRFTHAYRSLQPFWDEEAHTLIQQGRHPLDFDQLYTVDTHEQHLTAVNHLKSTGEPCIVIAASGMCAGGRMTNYLKALIDDTRTDVVFVGYQAKGTPGRDIQTYGPKGGYVTLDGERHDIRAQVHSLGGYSAHADQRDLLNFVEGITQPPQQIRVVHGDSEAKAVLTQRLQQRYPQTEVVIPNEQS